MRSILRIAVVLLLASGFRRVARRVTRQGFRVLAEVNASIQEAVTGISVAKNGIKKLVIINGHGGNAPSLNFAAQRINQDARIFVCVDTGETSDVDVDSMIETPNDVHAGEIETSTTLALRPDAVRMHLARPSVPNFSSEYLNFSSTKGVAWFARTKRISRRGVLGDPTRATAEKGRLMWDRIVSNLVKLVEDLKDLSLDEIHERRY